MITLKRKNNVSCFLVTNFNINSSTATNVNFATPVTCVRFQGTVINNALVVGSVPNQLWTSPTATTEDVNIASSYLVKIDGNNVESSFDITFYFATPITQFNYYAD
jgi:hypothetical protein